MEEPITLNIFIDDIVTEQRQDASKPLTGDEKLCGNNLIAQTDSLTEQGAVVVHRQQSLMGRIVGIEQTGIHLTVALVEVIA